METIQSLTSTVISNLALGVIALLAAYGMYYINKATAKIKAQTAKIEDESSRTLIVNALEDVNELAGVTVSAIEQTTAATLRQAVKDGTTDRAELLALGQQAFDDIKAKVTPEAQSAITENLGSFDAYLSNLIEAKVLTLKTETSKGGTA